LKNLVQIYIPSLGGAEMLHNLIYYVDKHEFSGASAVHYAVQSNSADVLMWLLKDRNLSGLLDDNLGRTATHIAASMSSLHALHNLHECKQLCFDSAQDGSTPLHLAARTDGISCVQLLIAAGHPTAVFDSQGSSPMHIAALEQNETVLLFLASHGNVDGYDSSGASPLMICVGKGLVDVIKSLLNCGASAAHRDYCGRSCLHTLLQLPHEQPHESLKQRSIAELLIKHGIDVNARDTSGRTPCHVAATTGNIEMLKLLMDKGGDVTVSDLSGKSCLMQLNRENFHKVTQIMIERIKFPPSCYPEVQRYTSLQIQPNSIFILGTLTLQLRRWATSV
jgi:serine/threonine-protein phosphatase 6 regulatory ankyrin repeat subunit A